MKYIGIDLFSGCGGLSVGMRHAGFDVKLAIETDVDAVLTYKINHPYTTIIQEDIRKVDIQRIKEIINGHKLHLLAGCPPCQGFSSVRKLNRRRSFRDERNKLIWEYLRFVKELKPLTIMMENVPGLVKYYQFKDFISELKELGYFLKYEVLDIKNYGVPQRRKRVVLVGSLLGNINIAQAINKKVTVRDAIGNLESVELTDDPLHKTKTVHTERIKKLISLIPKDGGSRKDLPDEYILECHSKPNVGFNDIYGRLRWDDYSTTITGGCLNPSKGRFLHPEEDRVITAREATMLQSFPRNYIFPDNISKMSLASLVGNALPPKFSYIQCKNIK